jgi:hypothetical protein
VSVGVQTSPETFSGASSVGSADFIAQQAATLRKSPQSPVAHP